MTNQQATSHSGLCSSSQCDHKFSLNPIKTGLYFHDETKINCCPQYCKKNKSFQNTWPQAFFDNKVHFPLFMLEADRQTTLKRERQYIESHHNKIKTLEMSNKQILVPHPGKSKITCFVCKSQYTDYRRHIQTKMHKKKLKSSKMQLSILQLIKLFQNSPVEFKDQTPTYSTQILPRLYSLKTQCSQAKISPRISKKQLKQIKLKQKNDQIQDILLKQGIDEQKNVEIQMQGFLDKVQDYRTTTINMTFKVQDYLI